LDTGDSSHDRVVVNNGISTRILLAYGGLSDDGSMMYHGTNRLAEQINFWTFSSNESTRDLLDVNDDGLVSSVISDYTLTASETKYVTLCIPYEDFDFPADAEVVYIDEIIAVLSPDTERYVHHFIGQIKDSCDGFDQGQFYGWAPGAGRKKWPVGYAQPFRRGESIDLEVHYDNPDGEFAAGLRDTSGINFKYSLEPPEHGSTTTLAIGDPTVSSTEVIGDGVSRYTFYCDGNCFANEEPTEIWYVGLHGHLNAEYLELKQLREVDGETVLVRKWVEEYYDFAFQSAQDAPVGETWDFLPGDSFEMTCIYDSDSPDLIFGESSNEEMCIGFITVLSEYNTRACAWLHSSTESFAGGLLNCLYDCDDHRSYPIFSYDEDSSRPLLCSFWDSVKDDECASDCTVPVSFLMTSGGCNDVEYGEWRVDEGMNDDDMMICSQHKTALIEHDVPDTLWGMRMFGKEGSNETVCAAVPEGGLVYEDDFILEGNSGGMRGVPGVLIALATVGVAAFTIF
jgi:hypothetical protein